MALGSDTAWFSPQWLKQVIHFDNPLNPWKITKKLQEKESRFSQDEYVFSGLYSKSCGIFVCEDTAASTQAIMKVRMQIPNSMEDRRDFWKTFSQPPEKEICGRSAQEIKALKTLSIAGCSCTPKYITSKHENKNPDGWVPEGFLDYIVMERVEGRTLSRDYIRDLRPEGRQNLRNAFKTSHLECQGFCFVNLDNDITNLIWKEKEMKCYIIDWGAWSRKAYAWNDKEYRWWGLHD